MSISEAVGTATINGFAYVGDLAVLSARAIRAVVVAPLQGRKLSTARSIHQAMAVGVEALPIVSLITFFIGVIYFAVHIDFIVYRNERRQEKNKKEYFNWTHSINRLWVWNIHYRSGSPALRAGFYFICRPARQQAAMSGPIPC